MLDAKYEKANLRAFFKDNCTHLSVPEQKVLPKLLEDFEELFDGMLGDWDCEKVSLQLKEGAQPFHGRPFPIPKKHVKTTKMEIQILCNLGVLKMARRFPMVLANIYNTQERHHSTSCQ